MEDHQPPIAARAGEHWTDVISPHGKGPYRALVHTDGSSLAALFTLDTMTALVADHPVCDMHGGLAWSGYDPRTLLVHPAGDDHVRVVQSDDRGLYDLGPFADWEQRPPARPARQAILRWRRRAVAVALSAAPLVMFGLTLFALWCLIHPTGCQIADAVHRGCTGVDPDQYSLILFLHSVAAAGVYLLTVLRMRDSRARRVGCAHCQRGR